jgi:non-ribosomal peptide synthetase component E (peptide arylation enzyme)
VEEGGVHLVLYTNIPLELEQVNHWLREAGFSNLLRVREVVHLPQLPLTATGKIDYKSLKKRG